MKSGRSYVGWVMRNTADVNWSGDVSLFPMFSGYRDNDTRSLRLTNNCATLGNLEHREVVVIRSEIGSPRRFDLGVYRAVESGEAAWPATKQERPR